MKLYLLHWGTGRYLMNWIQVVYFKLKEIWLLFSNAKAKKLSLFLLLLMKVWKKSQPKGHGVQWGTVWHLMNWIQVVYFKLKEIWMLFSNAKSTKTDSFFYFLSAKANENMKVKRETNEMNRAKELNIFPSETKEINCRINRSVKITHNRARRCATPQGNRYRTPPPSICLVHRCWKVLARRCYVSLRWTHCSTPSCDLGVCWRSLFRFRLRPCIC